VKSAIVFIVYNRPEYFQQVLDSVSKTLYLEKYDLFFNFDSRNNNVIKIATKFLKNINYPLTSDTIKINDTHLDCGANHRDGIDRIFSLGYDQVVCIEEDVLIANDTLKYFYQTYDLNLITCAFSHKFDLSVQENIFECNWFTPWVWSVNKTIWNSLKKNIKWNRTWDMNITNYVKNNNIMCLYPSSTRAENIGKWGLNQQNGNTHNFTFTISINGNYDENIEYKMYK